MRPLSTIEQRIAWTHFQRQTDKDVLMAMARWFCFRPDGREVRFKVKHLVLRSGISRRSVERGLERLETDWWIEVTARRRGSRQPTTYRIVLERLATVDPEALTTARVADETPPQPPQWRMNDEWRMKNTPDFEKVADQRSTTVVRTERSDPVVVEEVRHSGGRSGGCGGRPEHPDVPAFLTWALATYPEHAHGAHLMLDRERDGHLIHGLLETYPLERLQAMTVLTWTIEADGDPRSPASWIAHSDRSFRVLRYKAPFLERVVVGAQQLTFGPMEESFTARELEHARHARSFVYNGCPHEPRCEQYAICVREIAWGLKYGTS